MQCRYSLPRPSSRLIRSRKRSTSSRGMAELPLGQQSSKAARTALTQASVSVPSLWSILESMLATRIVAGASAPSTASTASAKRARPCRLILEVSCLPSWPRSVGSPDSRKSGPTSPRTSSSRTPVEPWELKSPQKTTGTFEGSRPSFFASFATVSTASCACLRRRSACCPAERWPLTEKSVLPARGASLPRKARISVRSLCCAETSSHFSARQKVAGRMRPGFSCMREA
mmetsp:Transcript_94998/g.306720  ORF Transcript_94998/g.306720 Transcript_94998/m.306720 type:complete len:230 (+) Transcript_94998:429-1118(+)